MDTRIEELTSIIVETCDKNAMLRKDDDKAQTYDMIRCHAKAIEGLLAGYRKIHPEEYE